MVSDEELRQRLRVVLATADLETTTEKQIRSDLEREFDCTLSDRKAIFQSEIEKYLEAQGEQLEEAVDEEPVAASSSKRKSGFGGRMTLSEPLAAFLEKHGEEGLDISEMTRNEVVKQLWVYIKAKDLQDPSNKRKILLDEDLSTVFTTPLNMFSLNSQLSKHCKSTKDLADPPAKKPRKAAKPSKEAAAKNAKEPAAKKAKKPRVPKVKDPNAPPTAAQKPQKISPAFQAVVEVETISRAQALKALWAYVKKHDLQNPECKQEILVKNDPKLFALLGVEKCQGFGMLKAVNEHFLGPADA